MAQPDYANRNEDRYVWWIETSGRLNPNTEHMPGIAIAYLSSRDNALYSPKGTETFNLVFVKQAEVITGLGGCACLGKFSVVNSESIEYGTLESELPIEFHEALVDYAISKGYEKSADAIGQAKYFKENYMRAVADGIAYASTAKVSGNTRAVVNSITGIR
jgi:hypothetical protein